MVLFSATPLVPGAGVMEATENGVVDAGVDGDVGATGVEVPQPERKATSVASDNTARFNLIFRICIEPPSSFGLDAMRFRASCSCRVECAGRSAVRRLR